MGSCLQSCIAVYSVCAVVCAVQVTPTAITPLLEWQGHDLEAWMATWDKHQVRTDKLHLCQVHRCITMNWRMATYCVHYSVSQDCLWPFSFCPG
jgi:hypothetical protein